MKATKIIATGALFLASAILFAGCAGITHEPKVDMSALPAIDDSAFINALTSIGIDESDVDIMMDTSFKFTDNDTYFAVVINLDATSEKENHYIYTQCADETTAKALFDYYYVNYDKIFDAREFSGISSHEIGSNYAYVLINGTYDNNSTNTFTPYHNALYLKEDTVIVVTASDYEFFVAKEINDFFNALGYPHP